VINKLFPSSDAFVAVFYFLNMHHYSIYYACHLYLEDSIIIESTRLEIIFFQVVTAQTARDIRVNFIPNKSLTKTAFRFADYFGKKGVSI